MTTKRVQSTVVIAVGVLSAGICGGLGCTPAAEAVLEGTWELFPSDAPSSGLTGVFITFDSFGKQTQTKFTFDDRATVVRNNPPGSASVDGDHVHISSTVSGNGLTFDGTLDSQTEPTFAAGSLTANLIFGDLQISVSQGEAFLVKR